MDLQEPKIIELLTNLLNNPDDKETFLSGIEEVKKKVERTEKSFTMNLEGNPEWIQEKCQKETQDAYDYIEEYLERLDELKNAKDELTEETISAFKDKFSDIINRLNSAFFVFREALLISWGPFEHSGINLLIAMAFKAKNIPESMIEVTQEIEPLLVIAKKIFETMPTNENEAIREAIDSWQEDYIRILEKGENLKHEELDDFLEELHVLGNRYYAIDLPRIISGYSENENTLTVSDIILECSELYQKEYMPAKLFKYALELSEAILQQLHALIPVQMEDKQEAEQTKDTENTEDTEDTEDTKDKEDTKDIEKAEEIKKDQTVNEDPAPSTLLNEAVTIMEDAVSKYYESLENSENDIKDCDELLKKGTDMFLKSLEDLKALADKEGKVPCMRCGTYTDGSLRFCTKCNAALPAFLFEKQTTMEVMDDSSYDNKTAMTSNIHNLFESAEKFYHGKITQEQLKNEINKFNNMANTAKSKNKNSQTEDDLEKEISENYNQGLAEIFEGIEFFKKLLDSSEGTYLLQGKERILSGIGRLQVMQKKIQKNF